jgi:hypothetical protein
MYDFSVLILRAWVLSVLSQSIAIKNDTQIFIGKKIYFILVSGKRLSLCPSLKNFSMDISVIDITCLLVWQSSIK